MRPGSYHKTGSHTEPSQGTAVARPCLPPPNHKMLCPHYFSQHMSNGWQHHHAEPHAWGAYFPSQYTNNDSVEKRDFEHIPYLKTVPLRPPIHPWTSVKKFCDTVYIPFPSSTTRLHSDHTVHLTIHGHADYLSALLPDAERTSETSHYHQNTHIHAPDKSLHSISGTHLNFCQLAHTC